MVNPAGVISTVAGNGTGGYSGDKGQAVAAMLGGPMGLAVDASSNLYIADSLNNRVRVVSPGAVVGAEHDRVDPGSFLLGPRQSPDRLHATAAAS